jgi:hypothetical protein
LGQCSLGQRSVTIPSEPDVKKTACDFAISGKVISDFPT